MNPIKINSIAFVVWALLAVIVAFSIITVR